MVPLSAVGKAIRPFFCPAVACCISVHVHVAAAESSAMPSRNRNTAGAVNRPSFSPGIRFAKPRRSLIAAIGMPGIRLTVSALIPCDGHQPCSRALNLRTLTSQIRDPGGVSRTEVRDRAILRRCVEPPDRGWAVARACSSEACSASIRLTTFARRGFGRGHHLAAGDFLPRWHPSAACGIRPRISPARRAPTAVR